jgi:glycosyltransferase involved in cell wall biosynthesis
MKPEQVRVVNILTSSLTVRLLEGQPEYFESKGFEFTVVSSPGEELSKARRDGVRTVAVSMAREISLWRDLVSLWRLGRVISRLRPTITNVATPKAGLLGGIAAWACRIPCRCYTVLGLRFETTTGLKRQLLLLAERVACLCAHRVICVSESLRQKAIEFGIVEAERAVILAAGSCNGVNPKRFGPGAEASRRADNLRRELRIPREVQVVGFVGRLTRDKGISELVKAYLELRRHLPELRLLLVGDMEEGDPLPLEIRRYVETESGIIRAGFADDPVPYYHVMDVLALPTYREGFPNVVLEASACGKPVVATRSTGVVDSVIDGVTGILVPARDSRALAAALQSVLNDRSLAAALGSAGRERVLREFQQERVWDAIIQEYLQLIQAKGLSIPNATRDVASTMVPNGPAAF